MVKEPNSPNRPDPSNWAERFAAKGNASATDAMSHLWRHSLLFLVQRENHSGRYQMDAIAEYRSAPTTYRH
jgi:hypothetical protein